MNLKTILLTIFAVTFYISLMVILRYGLTKIPQKLHEIALRIRIKADEQSNKTSQRRGK